jgi:oligopeptide transport system permease protein
MGQFLLKRALTFLIVIWSVMTITFFLIRIMPGGPFDAERKLPERIEQELMIKYNLDAPEAREAGEAFGRSFVFGEEFWGETFSLATQYWNNLVFLVQGDLRISTQYRNRSVSEILAQTLPVSCTLGVTALLIAVVAGVWLGTLAAMRKNTWVDASAMLGALFAISVPVFITGPVLLLIFGLWLQWLPLGGWTGPASVVLPAVCLALPFVAYIARLQRNSMLETITEDFVRTARAKGLDENQVIYKHALKVAILPVVSFIGPLAANLLTGSIVVEKIFGIPGAGRFFVEAVINSDAFLLQGVVLVYCSLLVLFNMLVDVAYTFLDKRIDLNG